MYLIKRIESEMMENKYNLLLKDTHLQQNEVTERKYQHIGWKLN